MLSTIALDAVAKISVLSAARQMFGRPGKVAHRKFQCCSVNSCGISDPGAVLVNVSMNRYAYISSSGALTVDSARTTGQTRKFPPIAPIARSGVWRRGRDN